MNEIFFILIVFMNSTDTMAEYKGPKVSFENVQACENYRAELFKTVPEVLERARCVAVHPPAKPVEVPKTSCVRPPSAGFASGRPCLTKSYKDV